MLRILGAGPDSELARTLDKFSDQKDRLKKELGSFIKWKNQYPVNGSIPGKMPGFGDSDKKFRSGGNFDNRMPNISHAHLTHNLSIVYYLDRDTNTLRLYGVYSHDNIGTGNPPNINRQQQMATRWTNMKFDASEAPSALQPDDKKQTATAQPTAGRPDYTPKAKVPATPNPKVANPLMTMANQIDGLWPQRNFARQFADAKSKVDQLAVINSEARYLDLVRKRHQLYPNQANYMKGLQSLFNEITRKK